MSFLGRDVSTPCGDPQPALMPWTNIATLKNRHHGATIYVVASGASVDYFDRRDFAGQIVVTVNEMWMHVPSTYALMHHHERAQEAIDAGMCLVTSERDWGAPGWGNPADFRGGYYTYKTVEYTRTHAPTIDVHALQADTTDGLVVSCCTTSEALQFAAHLGAQAIVCCGMDGAALDGRWCCRAYNNGFATNPQHVRLTQTILRETKAAIRKKGSRVYALSPFVGADHEGHVFTFAPELAGRDLSNALKAVNDERYAVEPSA